MPTAVTTITWLLCRASLANNSHNPMTCCSIQQIHILERGCSEVIPKSYPGKGLGVACHK